MACYLESYESTTGGKAAVSSVCRKLGRLNNGTVMVFKNYGKHFTMDAALYMVAEFYSSCNYIPGAIHVVLSGEHCMRREVWVHWPLQC